MAGKILAPEQKQALRELLIWFNQEIGRIKKKQADIIKKYDARKQAIIRRRIEGIKNN